MKHLLFRIKLVLGMLLTCLFFTSVTAEETHPDYLFEEFDPSYYTRDELRFIQLSLAFEGYYQGLLDGAWGKMSRRALTRYAQSVFDSEPLHAHSAYLAMRGASRVVDDNWQYEYYEPLGLSFLVPFASYLDGKYAEKFVNFEHGNSSLSYSMTFGTADWTQSVHEYAVSFHESYGAPYTVRKKSFAVTSSKNAQGRTLYVRSHIWQGMWATLLLSADASDAGLLGAVSSSISTDPLVRLKMPKSGLLLASTQDAAALLAEPAEGKNSNEVQRSSTDPQAGTASGPRTGSGFRVSDKGHILTNAHVVENCDVLKIDGSPVTLVKASESFDLALLQAEPASSIASFASSPARLNQDITVVGFPLSGLLGGINVTRGTISGMTGLVGDETTMQISAPVQVGNSGGPVVSSNGEVVGVVVSKLDAERLQEAFGDTPQNINFAVRAEVAKLFLTLNGVEPHLSVNAPLLAPEDLAETVAQYTVLIECE